MVNDPGLVIKPGAQNPQQQVRGQQKTFSVKKTNMMEPTDGLKIQNVHYVVQTIHSMIARLFERNSYAKENSFLRNKICTISAVKKTYIHSRLLM